MIHFYSLILFAYISLRLIAPLPISLAGKISVTAIILLISLKHFFFQHFFGGLASPDLPRFIILITGWLYVTLVFIFFFVLLRDALIFILWLISLGGHVIAQPLTGISITIGITASAFLCSTFGLYEAVRLPDIKKTEVILPRLPKKLDGLSIVQMTDLHANAFNPENKIRTIVQTINQLEPDIILLTGDIVDGTPTKRGADVAPLKELKARYGIFGSAGNHEYYSGFDAWQKKFSELEINMLYNSHNTLLIHGEQLVIAGITDPIAAQFEKSVPNVSAALDGAPEDVVRILMAHRPQDAQVHANAGVDLQLSGHTHGGQIIGLNQIVSRFNENLLMGWYDIGKMKLFVSTGISLWNGFPIRFGVPSEIPLIILRSGQ